jgi:hypothetical protein
MLLKDTRQFGNRGSSPTSTGGKTTPSQNTNKKTGFTINPLTTGINLIGQLATKVPGLGYAYQVGKNLTTGSKNTKNLNDMRVTGREIGLQNQNLTGSARDTKTEQDIQSAFRQQGAYATRRGIKKMAPSFTKIGATLLSKPLEKGTIRNRDFFTKHVLGNTKKGSLYGDKSFDGLTLGQRETMYGQYAKDRMNKTIDAYGRPVRPEGGGQQQNLCPDGTTPPCKTPVTQIKKPVSTPNPFLSGFKAYDDGGEVIISGNVDKDLL